jgi:hypothetical protein
LLFHLFLFGFAIDAQRRNRSCYQPFFGYGAVADLAYTEDSVIKTLYGFLNLYEQFSFSIPDAKLKVSV